MAEEWKLQVSYKLATGDLINVRAQTADELSILLEGIGDFATQIHATQRMLTTGGTLAPLSTTEYHYKHSASTLLSTAPGAGSIRYVNPWSGTDMRTRGSEVQVGNLQQDGKSIRDVGLSSSSGRRPMQASKLIPEEFPF
jgi:hypothetical protein